jgi:hypothetical protein
MAIPRAVCGGYPRAQRRAIALQDAKVRSIEQVDGAVVVRISAVVHVSAGAPGVDRGTTWSQELLLRIRGGVIERNDLGEAAWIERGALLLGAESFALLPFELARSEPVRLELASAGGALHLRGAGISLEPLDEPVFLERFPADPE